MKISLCMIVKDEAEVLARCLESVKDLVDEIVIADTGSTDETTKIAGTYTKNLYRFPWTDDFAAARNFAFSKGTGDYLMWLDADDVLPAGSAERFAELRKLLSAETPDVVRCPYDVAFDANGDPISTFFRERFLKRETGFVWQGRVHECIVPRGKIVQFGLHVRHLGSNKVRGARNLHIFQKWAREEPLGEREKFYYGRELYYNRLYTECIAVLEEMLGGKGWYVNKIEACKTLALAYEAKGGREAAKTALLRSFLYGEPRSAVLCELGRLFREENRTAEAIYWFEAALSSRDHSEEGDFETPDCRTVTPLLELVCLYYRTGDRARAAKYHKKTEELAPQHPSVIYNRQFFPSEE